MTSAGANTGQGPAPGPRAGSRAVDAGVEIVTVVGIGADGWSGLEPRARATVAEADVLLGGARHLALVPALAHQVARPWPSPLLPSLPGLLAEFAGRRVVVLASGDPLRSGVGSTLIDLLGAGRVCVLPAVSSVTLARARLGWSAESVDVLTLVGRELSGLRRLLTPGRRVIVLSSDAGTPAAVARMLVEGGFAEAELTVLGNLGAADESASSGTAVDFTEAVAPTLHVIGLELPSVPDGRWLPTVPGLPDEAFEHDGQLTKRDARAGALARLSPAPGHLLWDVGAGAGSIAIEWARTDPRCRSLAVERDPARAERIGRNAGRLGVAVRVVTGEAPAALGGLPTPDAVFVGGGATVPDLLETCWEQLGVGGRMVAHGVTLESERLLGRWFEQYGGELIRLGVERAEPLGRFTGWSPARPVTQWSATR